MGLPLCAADRLDGRLLVQSTRRLRSEPFCKSDKVVDIKLTLAALTVQANQRGTVQLMNCCQADALLAALRGEGLRNLNVRLAHYLHFLHWCCSSKHFRWFPCCARNATMSGCNTPSGWWMLKIQRSSWQIQKAESCAALRAAAARTSQRLRWSVVSQAGSKFPANIAA